MPIYLASGNSYYYTEEFKTIIRSCKDVLLSGATFSPFAPGVRFAYKYNFHKFLRNLRTEGGEVYSVPEELIWAISYINGITNPNQDFSHLEGLYTVTKEQIDLMIQSTRTRRE